MTTPLQPNEFPIGAALTVVYGSYTRPFCNLGDLYRILAYLTGYLPWTAEWIDPCLAHHAEHVRAALPTELQALEGPPDPGAGEAADVAWVLGLANKYGKTVTIAPTPETPDGMANV